MAGEGKQTKGARILAKSFFKELRENGYSCQQILALSTELIDLVTTEIKAEDKDAAPVTAAPVAANAGWRQAL